MNYALLIEFLFKFNLSQSDTATWIYVLLTLLAFVFVLGLFWGKLWNKTWSVGGHLGSFSYVLFFGFLAAFAVFNLRAISGVESWMEGQRITLARSIADSGTYNRAVHRATWNELYPQGGQADLTPPTQAGNELRLNNPDDAFRLAVNAAIETKTVLRMKAPFVLGAPLVTRPPSEIATEAVDAIGFNPSRFPTIVTASNEWSATAATIQVNQALDSAMSTMKPGMEDLRRACYWLLGAMIVLPLVLIPSNALADIKINPIHKI